MKNDKHDGTVEVFLVSLFAVYIIAQSIADICGHSRTFADNFS